MITFLDGKTRERPTHASDVDVGGVGYEVFIPLSTTTSCLLRAADPHSHAFGRREDAHVLYGFMTAAERVFSDCSSTAVSGIGPKAGAAVLSGDERKPISKRGSEF